MKIAIGFWPLIKVWSGRRLEIVGLWHGMDTEKTWDRGVVPLMNVQQSTGVMESCYD